MNEIEVKILTIDRKALEKKLLSMGAKKIFDGDIEGGLYDFPDKRLEKNREALRLRREGDEVVLTYKKHLTSEINEGSAKAKVADEIEVKVSDFDQAEAILKALNFKLFIPIKKKRVTYTLHGIHFAFDKYSDHLKNVPEFLEIEGDNVESVFEAVERLGFTREDCVSWGLRGLALHFLGEREAKRYGY